MTQVLIVGAGIGGLTTALTLHRLGMQVVIAEAASPIRELGTGINLLPHGAGVLYDLGLGEALAQTGIQTRAIEYRTQYGQLILRDPRGLHAGSPWPQISIHRGRLQSVLLDAVRQALPAERVLVGHRFARFDQRDGRVRATFLRRSDGETVDIEADLLIGADGIHSAVCQQVHPGCPPLTFSGTMMWRGMVETDPFLDTETMMIAGHHDTKCVVYPISKEAAVRGRALLNWVAEINVGKDAPHQREDWNRVGQLDEFVHAFEGFKFGFIDIPALFRATADIFVYPMADRDALPHWNQGHVTLLGDAAHPMYPIGANGASQAILDAAALGQAFEEVGPTAIGKALDLYQSLRLPATAQVVTSNRSKGPEAVLQLARDRIHGPDDDLDALISREEIDAITRQYQKVAGFDAATMSRRAAQSGAPGGVTITIGEGRP